MHEALCPTGHLIGEWEQMPVILTLGMWKQEEQEIRVILSCTAS